MKIEDLAVFLKIKDLLVLRRKGLKINPISGNLPDAQRFNERAIFMSRSLVACLLSLSVR
jgi:hypothetical protein